MKYYSTRSGNKTGGVTAAEAIKQGLAEDGGLFMPETIPTLAQSDLAEMASLDYPHRAAKILKLFLTDYTDEELLADATAAYSPDRFEGGVAPVKEIGDGMYALELWHGPTAAFKDMALQLMPRLLSRALKKTGETRTAAILVATSGDTGKAALEGYRDVDQVKIQVFYPQNGVSRVQKMQMATQEGSNVDVCAIVGNFDDAQSGVKRIFSDHEIAAELNRRNCFLSSANSINWGRLVPQIVYYVSAYCDMAASGAITMGEALDVCVPTGNFGNIFAACIAKRMGVPLGKLVCASNCNNVLTDFLATGRYDRNREFHTTMSPSMDILISSNLERLLYTVAGAEKTGLYMKKLAAEGAYQVEPEVLKEIQSIFAGFFATEKQTAEAVRKFWNERHYLADTHTGVALSCAEQYRQECPGKTKMLVVSTASAYKFAADVYASLTGSRPQNELGALDELSALTGSEIVAPLRGIGKRTVHFSRVIRPEEMEQTVLSFAEK